MNELTDQLEQEIAEHLSIKTKKDLQSVERDTKDQSLTFIFGGTRIVVEASFIQDKTEDDRLISISERIDSVLSSFNANLNQAGEFWFSGKGEIYTIGSRTMKGLSDEQHKLCS